MAAGVEETASIGQHMREAVSSLSHREHVALQLLATAKSFRKNNVTRR
jgi:hypothetical protein